MLPVSSLHPCSEEFDVKALISSGAWSEVYLVEKKSGVNAGKVYAMKVMLKSKLLEYQQTTIPFNEVEVLQLISGKPFHSTLRFVFSNSDKLFIVTDFVQSGDLYSQFVMKASFSEDEARFYITQVILAIGLLHQQNIVYRDVKLENILLDASGNIVLCDYGSSKVLKRSTRTHSISGTPDSMVS